MSTEHRIHKEHRSALPLMVGGFFLSGIVTVLLGPLIPELEAIWGVGHAETGLLFVAQFSGSSIGSALSSFHLRRSLIGGFALISTGLFLLAGGGWDLAWVAMALLGAGLGSSTPRANLWVAHTFPERRGAALSVLNLVWGLGAMVCPLLFAALLGRAPATWALVSLGTVAGLVSVLWFLGGSSAFRPRAVPTGPDGTIDREHDTEHDGASIGVLALLAAMLFLYIGVENAIGGWLVALTDQLLTDPLDAGRSTVSLLIGSAFWGALLVGRFGAPFFLRRMPETKLYAASLAVATGGTLVLLFAGSRSVIATGAVLAGLGLAALFPLTVSLLAAWTASTESRTTGWVFAFGGLGGATLPWLTGRVAPETGSAGPAFWVPLAGLLLLAVLFAGLRSLRPDRRAMKC